MQLFGFKEDDGPVPRSPEGFASGGDGLRSGEGRLLQQPPGRLLSFGRRRPPLERQRGGAFEMGADVRRSGRWVASQNCVGDRAVLAHRGFEHLRGENVADLRHDERQMEPRRDLAQLQVAGERHCRVVEGGVLGEIIRCSALAIVEDLPDFFGEADAGLLVAGLGGETRRERLHLDPDLKELADRPRSEVSHQRAAMGQMLDEPFGGEPGAAPLAPGRG